MNNAHIVYRWHVQDLPDASMTKGIDCVIMAFANSSNFVIDPARDYIPFKPVADVRSMFSPETKVLIAIGGWGDTKGFSQGAANQASRELFAKNVAKMLDTHGYDGVGKINHFHYAGTMAVKTC